MEKASQTPSGKGKKKKDGEKQGKWVKDDAETRKSGRFAAPRQKNLKKNEKMEKNEKKKLDVRSCDII